MKKMAGVLTALSLLASIGSGFTALADTVYVNASSLNYRSDAAMTGTILGALPRGTKLEREKDFGEWSVVKVDGQRVYMASRYLSASAPEQLASKESVQTHASNAYIANSWDVALDLNDEYASFAKIKSGKAVYYQTSSTAPKNKTVCVNAGHGTESGSSVKTLCHPDGTPKVTSGTTTAGATSAVAVSSGMTFSDGTPESTVTLTMAKILRDELLKEGYDVLMIREEADVQLDNIARTVLANNHADCHIALHWDSTTSDKGCFYMSVPNVASYRAMEPVASHWESHNRLGNCLIMGLKEKGNKIFSSGEMAMDLTQTSYSTIPSVDIELGDKASSHSDETLRKLAGGLIVGINQFFEQSK